MPIALKPLSRVLLVLVTAAAILALAAPAAPAATKARFFEETAQAFWVVPYQCADGSTVDATLLVASTRDYTAPDTQDSTPTVRVQYLAVCPDGTSFSWIGFLPATITSDTNLKGVVATASGTVRDNSGGLHAVAVDVTWTAIGPVVSTTNGPGSTRKERAAAATGTVTFDGVTLVDGPANHPTQPAPFIRVDIEK